MASTEPGMGWWASHTTPSRSHRIGTGELVTVWSSSRAGCQPVRVPRFEPFPALRYHPSLPLDLVCAPPYDVLDDDDLDELEGRHDRNIVRLDVPRERDGAGRYEQAAQRLAGWIDDATLVEDATPAFTFYRMQFVDEEGISRETVGVVGALEVVDEGAGGVLPHERTTPKASSDRLELTRATSANLSPVWGLSLAAGLSDLLSSPGEPLGSTTDEHGVIHHVERVDDPDRCAAISDAIAGAPVVIADGHHRYAISRTYRDEVRSRRGGDAGTAELTLTYLGELVDEQLNVAAIHRLYHEVDHDALAEHLSRSFHLEPAGPVTAAITAQLASRGCLCLVAPDGTGTWLLPRPEAFHDVRDLDSSRLEHALADLDHEVTYQHGVSEVLRVLSQGQATAGILIRPVTVAEIQRTAHEQLLMPPKSTFFSPKLRTGLVIRRL
jgi:uncharacterized protein (DUF1015 family)